MSNYNSNLQANNIDLQEILNMAKNLPEAAGGSGELPELTNEGAASDLRAGKELIDSNGNIITGTMPNGFAKTPATTITQTPSISVDSSGLITASVSGTQNVTPTVSAGYVSSGTAGTIMVSGSATKQLTTQAAKTITPTKSNQTAVSSGVYTTGAITVAGEPNLISGHIKKGISIFGVVGTANVDEGGSTTPSQIVAIKDVNFYDCDGTRLYSYTLEEAQALTELPPLPSRDGLITQSWNYDLATIKSYNRAVDIGATYTTDDGKTRLYIRIATEGRMTIPLYFSQTVTNGVIIDWGDDSAVETLSGTNIVNTSHTYANIGDYIISLDVTNGCIMRLGAGSTLNGLLGDNLSNLRLQKIELGNNTDGFSYYTLANCKALTSVVISKVIESEKLGHWSFNGSSGITNIVIPNGVTTIGTNMFSGCTSLSNIIIPNSVTSISEGMLQNAKALANIIIPNSVTSIGNSAFYGCEALVNVVIPNSVRSIGSNAFAYCRGMAIYDFTSHTSVPTLSNTNAFTNIPSDCEIRVPASLYDKWIAATNWSTYASQIVAV